MPSAQLYRIGASLQCVYKDNSHFDYLFFIIFDSEVLARATECLSELAESMESELDEFCNQSNWLIQLNEYLSVWEGKREGGEGFKSIKAEEIEVHSTCIDRVLSVYIIVHYISGLSFSNLLFIIKNFDNFSICKLIFKDFDL